MKNLKSILEDADQVQVDPDETEALTLLREIRDFLKILAGDEGLETPETEEPEAVPEVEPGSEDGRQPAPTKVKAETPTS